ESQDSRAYLERMIAKGPECLDAHEWVRSDTPLGDLAGGTLVQYNEGGARLLPLLDGGDRKEITESMQRVDALRDDLNRQLDEVRTEMVNILQADSAATIRRQQTVVIIAIVLTALAAALGLVFSVFVS